MTLKLLYQPHFPEVRLGEPSFLVPSCFPSLAELTRSHLPAAPYVLKAAPFLFLVLASFLSSGLELSVAHEP